MSKSIREWADETIAEWHAARAPLVELAKRAGEQKKRAEVLEVVDLAFAMVEAALSTSAPPTVLRALAPMRARLRGLVVRYVQEG